MGLSPRKQRNRSSYTLQRDEICRQKILAENRTTIGGYQQSTISSLVPGTQGHHAIPRRKRTLSYFNLKSHAIQNHCTKDGEAFSYCDLVILGTETCGSHFMWPRVSHGPTSQHTHTASPRPSRGVSRLWVIIRLCLYGCPLAPSSCSRPGRGSPHSVAVPHESILHNSCRGLSVSTQKLGMRRRRGNPNFASSFSPDLHCSQN